MGYIMPPENQWVPLKIVNGAYEYLMSRYVVDGQIREGELEFLTLDLVHISSLYGQRPSPYKLTVPAEDVTRPYREPQNGKMEYLVNSGSVLLQAIGVPNKGVSPREREELPQRILSKNVMGRICYRLSTWKINGQEVSEPFDSLHDNVLPVPELKIQIHYTGGRVVDAQITWDSVTNIVQPESVVPGVTVSAFVPTLGKIVTACRVGDRWHDLNEV